MRTTPIIAALLVAAGLALSAPARSASDDLVYFLTDKGEELLEKASEKDDFWPLIAAFVSEKRETYCGIASSVMVLNALKVPPPLAPTWYPNRYWDEDNIFTEAVLQSVESVQLVEMEGITLAQLATMLDKSGAKAEPVFASDTDLEKFRAAAIATLRDPGAFLIVNVGRAVLGQGTIANGGHISPIGAYNAEEDRFLMLDVARYKYEPSWIPAVRLFRAMNTLDTTSGKTRGYVIARR